MDIVIIIRVFITLSFFILASGGPYAIILLRRFIKRYAVAHEALEARVEVLERLNGITTETPDEHR